MKFFVVRFSTGKLIIMIFSTRAAYKGFADTVRLLLFRDASQGRQDKEGILNVHIHCVLVSLIVQLNFYCSRLCNVSNCLCKREWLCTFSGGYQKMLRYLSIVFYQLDPTHMVLVGLEFEWFLIAIICTFLFEV